MCIQFPSLNLLDTMDLIPLTGSFKTKDYRILISQVQSQSGQYGYTVKGKPNIKKVLDNK